MLFIEIVPEFELKFDYKSCVTKYYHNNNYMIYYDSIIKEYYLAIEFNINKNYKQYVIFSYENEYIKPIIKDNNVSCDIIKNVENFIDNFNKLLKSIILNQNGVVNNRDFLYARNSEQNFNIEYCINGNKEIDRRNIEIIQSFNEHTNSWNISINKNVVYSMTDKTIIVRLFDMIYRDILKVIKERWPL